MTEAVFVGGDEICGRVLCGLPISSVDFTVLPIHFPDAVTNSIFNWELILPGYSCYPFCFQACLPYLLASLVYHKKWLRENIFVGHALFRNRYMYLIIFWLHRKKNAFKV